MILSDRMRQSCRVSAAPRRGSLYAAEGHAAAEHVMELRKVEQEIEDTNARVKRLADELGARYAVFRCDNSRYDDGREDCNTEIIHLSRQTDECIQSIYHLEHRRKELLRRIGK